VLFFSIELTNAQTTSQNFVYSRTILKEGVKTTSDLANLPADSLRGAVQYLDGLGRPMQNLLIRASSSGNDIITPITYDMLGREDKNYLPYSSSGVPGSYRQNALTEQGAFYNMPSSSIPIIPNPYSQIIFEASPLNRVLEIGAAGQSWAIGNGHTIQNQYEFNNEGEIRIWGITVINNQNTGASSLGFYGAGQLYKNITKDEHQSDIIEYKDKEGKLICKKVQDNKPGGQTSYATTYYIYDDFGSLVYILPPALSDNKTSFNEIEQDFHNYIYAYHYDERKRLTEKKVPGKDWQYTVYDGADRPVFTQNAEQRSRQTKVWGFIKYDALGRIIITGEFDDNSDRATMQANYIGDGIAFEFWDSYFTFGYTPNYSFPAMDEVYNGAPFKIFVVNYYDDYNFLDTYILGAKTGLGFTEPTGTSTESLKTKGLLTATLTYILGKSNIADPQSYLLTVMFYDDKGRISKVFKEHQLNGVDAIINTYNFAGELTGTTRKHYKDGALVLTATTTNNYDNAGRITNTTETINGSSSTTQFTYNAIGQLETKTVGNQTIAYAYNPRGWVKSMNASLFSMSLNYDQSVYGAQPQFNGNISSQQWITNGQSHYYTYSYDKASRLLTGTSDEGYNENLGYDKMGNILNLNRPKLGNIAYGYNGNQLQTVSGYYNRTYFYNSNGSMTGDGVLNVQYNELNLPKQVMGTPVGTVNYTYDAGGSKLTKQTVSETRQYVDGIEYIGSTIDLLHIAEGVARNNGGSYTFEYM